MVDAGGHRYLMGIEKWQLVVVVGLVSLIAVTREIVVDVVVVAAAAVALLVVVRAIVASAAAPCRFLFSLSVELEEVRYFACPFVLYDGTYRRVSAESTEREETRESISLIGTITLNYRLTKSMIFRFSDFGPLGQHNASFP